MGVHRIAPAINIAVSGLRAESARMNVIANNIANASTSRTPSGQPYRAQEVVVSTAGEGFEGVKVQDVLPDMTTDFKQVYQPGHPDADKDGFVKMPNVELSTEMMHLVTASRAYQANAAMLKRNQEMVDVTVELLK